MDLPGIFKGTRRRLFIQLIANAFVQAGLLYVNAMLIKYAFDHLINGAHHRPDQAAMVCMAMVGSAFSTGLLQSIERQVAEKLGQSYIHNLRMRLFRHVSRLDPRNLQKRRRGAVMLKFVGDLNALRRWVSLGIVRIIISGAITLSALTILLMINWLLSAVTALIIGGGIVINIRIGQSLRRLARETRKRRSRLSGNINEKLARMSVVQVFGRREREIKRVRRQSVQLKRAMVSRAARIGQIRGITYCGVALAVTAILFTGIVQVGSGKTTPGTVAAAMVVIGFLGPALKNLSRVYEYYQDAAVAQQKLRQFLNVRAKIKLGARLPALQPGPGHLRFEDVTVDGVFEGLTLEARPGQVIAVVGPNGAGKSVLIELVARLIPPDRGTIEIDGKDIASVSLESARRMVGIVSPDLPLLAGSIDANLCYRNADVSSAELERIARLCKIDELMHQLPHGSDTRLQEGGRNLSVGQRQRIMLARALVGSPCLLLLDEVDAHLDRQSRQILSRVIRTFNGTVLWVTHQQIPLVGVDAIWRITDGTIHNLQIKHLDNPRLAAG